MSSIFCRFSLRVPMCLSRVELGHRRRKLLANDPFKMGAGGRDDGRLSELEAEIEERSLEVLSLRQRSSKIGATAGSIRGQLSELEVRKQIAVDAKNFTEAAQIKSRRGPKPETLNPQLHRGRLDQEQARELADGEGTHALSS